MLRAFVRVLNSKDADVQFGIAVACEVEGANNLQ